MGYVTLQSRSDIVNCLAILHSRKHVPDDQMKLFCEILHFRADLREDHYTEQGRARYRERIQPLFKGLDFPLCRPKYLTKLILPKQSEYTHLCDLHRELNADFVHQWFKLLALEVGARLEDLRSSSEKTLGSYIWLHYIKPLTRLHKLWESPQRTQEAFGDFIEVGLKKDMYLIDARSQLDKCEACILARIGGHPQTIMCLRAIVKSRLTPESQERHRSRLRLLRLTENWLALWQLTDLKRETTDYSSLWQKHLKENDLLAEDIWEKRKQLEIECQRNRKDLRHKLNQGNLEEAWKYEEVMIALDASEKAGKNCIHDAENDIIDTYAALRSTQRTSRFFSMLDSLGSHNEALEAPKASHPSRRSEMLAERSYGQTRHQAQDSPNESDVLSDNLSSMKIGSCEKGSPDTYVDPFYLESKYPADSFRTDPSTTRRSNARSVASVLQINPANRESRYSTDTISNNDRVLPNDGSKIHLPQRASTVSRASRNSKSFESKSGHVRRSNTVMTWISEESPTMTEFSSLRGRQQLPLAERDANGIFRSRYSSASITRKPQYEKEKNLPDEYDDKHIPDSLNSWITASIPDSRKSYQSSTNSLASSDSAFSRLRASPLFRQIKED